MFNAKLSGDLGVATMEPRKGRPAAIGRELKRLVIRLIRRLPLVMRRDDAQIAMHHPF